MKFSSNSDTTQFTHIYVQTNGIIDTDMLTTILDTDLLFNNSCFIVNLFWAYVYLHYTQDKLLYV